MEIHYHICHFFGEKSCHISYIQYFILSNLKCLEQYVDSRPGTHVAPEKQKETEKMPSLQEKFEMALQKLHSELPS